MSEHKVQLRGGFSDRNKLVSINTTIQTFHFDDRTKIAIINLLRSWVNSLNTRYRVFFYVSLFADVFCEYVDNDKTAKAEYRQEETFNEFIYNTIMFNEYGEILTLVEYICNWFEIELKPNQGEYGFGYDSPFHNGQEKKQYAKELNNLFEQEYVGYRMIDETIVAITDPIEIKEIEDCLDIQFQGAKSHIQKALGFLADREHKDYKNCIKESISAVESICEIIVEDTNATLGKALKALKDKKIGIHPALEKAFSSLYGYTSDEGGIRHAEGLFESNVSFEEAKYMLVSCCAFVNYLIAEYGKTQSVNGEQ